MATTMENRYEFVYLFDVENGNPNGDPDAGNMPRIDPETNHGLVTDVCLKRKIRNYVLMKNGDNSPNRIYVKEFAILNLIHEAAYETLGIKKIPKSGSKKGKDLEAARDWMCNNFFDVRSFGAVMSTDIPCGIVRGPVQINFAKSIDPITPLEITITRVAITKESDAEKKEHEFGRKHIVPYGLYRAEGYISANFAQKTKFSEDDLQLLWESLINMFDHDHSAARGKMSARKLVAFKHNSRIGSAPAHKLFDLISVKRKTNDDVPARSYHDYEVSVNGQNVPQGVELIELL